MPQGVEVARKSSHGFISAVMYCGLIIGTLDIIAAFSQSLLRGGDPVAMLKFIASGIFGPGAFKGGTVYAVIGLLFHYCIATIWALILFLVYPKISFNHRWVLVGIGYGVFVWIVMNFAVLPLSNTPALPRVIGWTMLISILIIVIAIGLPAAYLAHRYYRNTTR